MKFPNTKLLKAKPESIAAHQPDISLHKTSLSLMYLSARFSSETAPQWLLLNFKELSYHSSHEFDTNVHVVHRARSVSQPEEVCFPFRDGWSGGKCPARDDQYFCLSKFDPELGHDVFGRVIPLHMLGRQKMQVDSEPDEHATRWHSPGSQLHVLRCRKFVIQQGAHVVPPDFVLLSQAGGPVTPSL